MFQLFQKVLRLLGKLSITPVTLFTPTMVLSEDLKPSGKGLETIRKRNSGLETIRKRNKATLVFKSLNNLAPAYFKNYFTRNSSNHFYNTRQKQDLHIPKAKLSKGRKTFRFSGATLFNRLPDSLKQAKSLQIFKRNIGHYSF